jgi:SAM-dependent methyltransferase
MLPRRAQDWLRVRFNKSRPQDDVFGYYHNQNVWGDQESVSGPGSTLDYTASIRTALPELLAEFNIRSILDIPCGDFNWMGHVDLAERQYIGADIVPDLIAANQNKYGQPGREFRVLDLTKGPLPEVDLLLCRDCLMHLCPELIDAALANILRGKIRYLLTTTHPKGKNKRILTGEWFPINLQRAPYRFPQPQRAIRDWVPPYAERELCLWEISTLRTFMSQS